MHIRKKNAHTQRAVHFYSDIGYRLSGNGYRLSVIGNRILDIGRCAIGRRKRL